MRKRLFIISIATLLLSCNPLKTNREPHNKHTPIPENELCSVLQEFEILRTFSSENTNLPNINAILTPFAKGVSATMYTTQIEFEEGIENHLREFENHYGASTISGREYIKQQLIKRISDKLNFNIHNLIIVTINSGGPPFHSVKCTLKNDVIYIKGVKPKSEVSGMALMMNTRFFSVNKKMKLK